MELPESVIINAEADDGAPVEGTLSARAIAWALRTRLPGELRTAAPPPESQRWDDPAVGWGLVLPDDPSLTIEARDAAADAPEPIRRLLAARPGSPVLRFVPPERGASADTLRQYLPGTATFRELAIGLTRLGIADGRIPQYLLIFAGPDAVPWSVQYSLNRRHFVGRLALDATFDDAALGRYVHHLIEGWPNSLTVSGAGVGAGIGGGAKANVVVWSTEYDRITRLMSDTIGKQVAAAAAKDDELAVQRIGGAEATGDSLAQALDAQNPAIVVTTSHGRTAPLDDPAAMRARLGVLVDQNHSDVSPVALAEAKVGGSLWFAYACCSAGSDGTTSFAGLLTEGTKAHTVVSGVTAVGSTISPLPQTLLSAAVPVRAFVGQVEPTFDWSLTLPDGAHLVTDLVDTVYPRLYQKPALGPALERYYGGVGELYARYSSTVDRINRGEVAARNESVYYALTARDRQSLVILGDPTVFAPPLPSQRTAAPSLPPSPAIHPTS